MEQEKRIIEVGGVKLEIDMRYARAIEHYRIGDHVKVLIKNYGDSYESYPGIIVRFENFEKLPGIVIAYANVDTYSADMKFQLLNAETKDVEICPMVDDELPFTRGRAEQAFDHQIKEYTEKLNILKAKRDYFFRRFGELFPDAEESK